ncbi:ExeA family protein [Nevskia ramosa]|uniref:ExeA family protein n=1 Tax=Nevskia ramosa TaxID=64002 RepID=UPI0023567CD6|nr:ExeA family protein [Nevskia ramosa]
MYAAHYKLREPPFSIAPDPAFLYMSSRHQEALGHLLYGTGQYGGFVQLTGEVGTGKTTIVRTLLAQKLDNVDIAMIHNPRQNEIEFVASILDELGVDYPGRSNDPSGHSIKTLVDALNQHLLASHAAGRRTVLIIDEAQNLPTPVLEQVRLLTNLETTKEKLLRIMLIGQPELVELLNRPELRQLASRITARFHLTPLTVVETMQYIIHRLHVVGGPSDLFTDPAMRSVHRYARGIPRQINIICDRSLLGAYARGLRSVTPAIVDQAAVEVTGVQPSQSASGWLAKRLRPRAVPLPWVESALAIAALVIAGVLLNQTLNGGSKAEAKPAAVAAAATEKPKPTPVAAPAPAAPAPAAQLSGVGALQATAQPLPVVMSRLIGLWQPGLSIPRGQNVCRALARNAIDCYKGDASWDELRQMNHPAILTLEFEDGSRQYALLRAVDGDNAIIDTANGPLRLPFATLDPLWNSEFLMLWQRPIEESQIDSQTRGDSVLWLRRTLAKADGKTLTGALPTNFGAELKTQVLRFQTSHGLPADGIAGTRTLMLLGNLSPKPGTPSLRDAP